jgi:hypothetical protein
MLDRFITITADLANELKKLDPKPHTTQFPDRM